MSPNKIVSREAWVEARKILLKQEKEFTKLRDQLSQQRRKLPWNKIEKDYFFESANGKESLSDLFGSCSQLIVYHFMFDPEWLEGCKSCSLLADHYNPAIVHLKERGVAMVTVSRAPLKKLLTFRDRMGWTFEWVSSFDSDFNRDFHVTFKPEEMEQGTAYYNYENKSFPVTEAPGISVFYKNEQGDIFHTYSSYARGLDLFINTYNLLDIVPKGRDEDDLPYTMEWVRHHDRYGDDKFVDPYLNVLSNDEINKT